MKLEKLIRKSHYYNEDRIVIGKNYFMVMDGATPLKKNGIKPTEAAWFVTFIKNLLPQTCNNIIEKLNEISVKSLQQLKDWNIAIQDQYLPSSGLAWVKLEGDMISANTIGDCEVTIRFNSGEIKRIYQTELIALDDIAVKEMVRIAKEKNITMREARKCINDVLIKNRLLMNKENGYNVFTPSEKPQFKFTTAKFNVKDIKEIYIYTDGISQAFDELQIYKSHKNMFEKSFNIKEEINKIVKAAYLDKDFELYPRFKTIDDIAVIKITI